MGWVLDYSKPIYLIAEGGTLKEAVRILRKIGVEQIDGAFSPSEIKQAKLTTESYENVMPLDIASKIGNGEVTLIDVRSESEWNAGHIPQADFRFLGHLPEQLDKISDSKLFVVHCQSGARSAIATSLLQAAGKRVVNLVGGFVGWHRTGLPVTTAATEACSVDAGDSCSYRI